MCAHGGGSAWVNSAINYESGSDLRLLAVRLLYGSYSPSHLAYCFQLHCHNFTDL